MKKILFAISMIAIFAVSALSKMPYLGVFNAKYGVKGEGALAKAKCGVCHVGMTAKLNLYGADVKAAAGPDGKVTADVLAMVESKDSDGDGLKNGAELKAGSLPGDKTSK